MGRSALLAMLWWIAALCALAATAAWVGVGEFGPAALDREGLILANTWRSPWLDKIFLGLTWLGSLFVLLPLALIAGILLWRRGHRDEAGFLVAAVLGASVLAQATKHLALRPRPDLYPALCSVASPLSLPSAHAVQVTALAAALLPVVTRLAPHRRRWALPVLVSIVAAVGVSRLYLQVHYPSDVLAGTLAAACWVAGLQALMLTEDGTLQINDVSAGNSVGRGEQKSGP